MKQISPCEVLLQALIRTLSYRQPILSSLLVDDLELVSLLEAQVAVMLGLIAVYGHHQVVCEDDIIKLKH